MKLEGHEIFVSRLYDAMAKCSFTGKPVMTSFLSPAQQEIAKTLCKEYGIHFDGGFPDAERKVGVISESFDDQTPADLVCLKAEINPLLGSIAHPDVLGTLMREGISRDVLGDFICTPKAVWIFCKENMADYIANNILCIKKQNLKWKVCSSESVPTVEFKVIQINAASLRYDAVVAGLAKCSRSKAMEMIKSGLVKVNDIELDHNGRLCNNDHISIRRCGRFQFLETVKTTRKDRLVLEFKKYA